MAPQHWYSALVSVYYVVCNSLLPLQKLLLFYRIQLDFAIINLNIFSPLNTWKVPDPELHKIMIRIPRKWRIWIRTTGIIYVIDETKSDSKASIESFDIDWAETNRWGTSVLENASPMCNVWDPDSFRSVDPDPDSGSGSRRSKMTH